MCYGYPVKSYYGGSTRLICGRTIDQLRKARAVFDKQFAEKFEKAGFTRPSPF